MSSDVLPMFRGTARPAMPALAPDGFDGVSGLRPRDLGRVTAAQVSVSVDEVRAALAKMGHRVPANVDLGSWLSNLVGGAGVRSIVSAAASLIPGAGPLIAPIIAGAGPGPAPALADPTPIPPPAPPAPTGMDSKTKAWLIGGGVAAVALIGVAIVATR